MEPNCKEASLEERQPKTWEHLTLQFNDPGKLMRLLASLYERSSVKLLKKLNGYEETKSDLAFVVERVISTDELFVSVLGENILDDMITITGWEGVDQKPVKLTPEDLPVLLSVAIEDELQRLELKALEQIYAIPITLPHKHTKVVLYIFLVNPQPLYDFVHLNIGLVKECMRYCVAGITSVLVYEEERIRHDKCKSVLDALYRVVDKLGNSEVALKMIEKESGLAVNGETAYLYIVERNHLVTRIMNFGKPIELWRERVYNVRVPLGVGLAGIVAETGQIINCTDPKSDTRYSNVLDLEARLVVRNILVFPLIFENKVIGVIEVYNKRHAKNFTKIDEELCTPLGILYGAFINQSLLFSKLLGSVGRDAEVNDILLSRMKLQNDDMVDVILKCKDHDFGDVTSYLFDVYALEDEHTVCLVLHMFAKLGFMTKFMINEQTFVRFVLTVKEGCMKVPFHNWQHTLATFHFMACLLNNLDIIKNEFITVIEGLALLMATLCHDLDYRGPTTPFQVTTGTVLGSLYSSPGSVAQYFHSSQALRLLSQEGCNIFTNLSEDQYFVIVKMLIRMIVYTNLAEHLSRREAISEMIEVYYNSELVEHRQLLHSLLITCCDLNDYVKPWHHCRSIAEATFNEFFREGDLKYAVGVFKVSDMKREFTRIPDLQSNFIETICLPAFQQLAQLFPSTLHFVTKIQENMADFARCKEEFERQAEEQFLEPAPPPNEDDDEYEY